MGIGEFLSYNSELSSFGGLKLSQLKAPVGFFIVGGALMAMPLKKIVQSYLFLFQKGIIVCRQKKNPENAREERFIFIKYFPINNIDLKVVSEDCFDLHNSETEEKLKIVFFESSKHEDKTGAGGIFCNTVD